MSSEQPVDQVNNEEDNAQTPPVSEGGEEENKDNNESGNNNNNNEAKKKNEKTYTSVQDLGVCCDRNARYRRTMEDEHVIQDGFGGVETQGYFAVYDGHGGKKAVEFVANNLHNYYLEFLENDDPITALKKAYKKTDDRIGEEKIQFSGTTTVSALIRIEDGVKKLYVGNCGDARAVLCRDGVAQRLTYDHKASDESETQRIIDAGGFVVMNRVNGILAVTRALGDYAMKDYVSGDPYCETHELSETDTHLIIACDGVWDVVSDQDAIDFILQFDSCQEAAKKLLRKSLKNGSTDNISVMVIKL